MQTKGGIWRGIWYGCIFSLEGLWAMGFGDGTAIPAGLFTAPLGLVPYIDVMFPFGLMVLIVPPLLWSSIYYLIENENIKKVPLLAIGILAAHYVGAFILLGPVVLVRNDFNDWRHLIAVSNHPLAILLLAFFTVTYIFVQWHVLKEIRKNYYRFQGHHSIAN